MVVWAPAKAPGRSPKATMRAIGKMRGRLVRVFNRQRRWLMADDRWQLLLTPADRKAVAKADDAGVTSWRGWDKIVAQEVRPGIAEGLSQGAAAGQAQIGITVDWTLSNPRALKYMTEHGLDLAKGINLTTKKDVRRIVRSGLKEGLDTPSIAKNVGKRVDMYSKRRATLVAQTETIGAQAEGTLQYGDEIGAEHVIKKWLDLRPNHDEICAGLHGMTAPLRGVYAGGYERPPAHPGCQCAIILVATSTTGVGEGL